jgi:hypothetical protein
MELSMARKIPSDAPPAQARPLSLLSVVIPARDEEGCVCSTVEHLHLERWLHTIPHEIVVADDASTDATCLVASTTGSRSISAAAITGNRSETPSLLKLLLANP